MHASTDRALAARQSARGRTRREDMRLAAAQVSRLAAEGLPPGALLTSAALRAHFLVFMDDTRALLAAGAHGTRLLHSGLGAMALRKQLMQVCMGSVVHFLVPNNIRLCC